MGQNLDHAGGPTQPAALVTLTAVPFTSVTPLHDVFQRDTTPTTAPSDTAPRLHPLSIHGTSVGEHECQYAHVLR